MTEQKRQTVQTAGNTRHAIPAPTAFKSPNGETKFRVHNGKYSDAVAKIICEQIMQQKSLKEICAIPGMPSFRTVVRWLADPRLTDFREMYYYARRVQAELFVDEIFEIADNETDGDWTEVFNKDGELVGLKPNNEAIQRSRVRIDARKWYAAKMIPRLYGDKVEHSLDVTGDLAELLKKASNNDTGLPKLKDGD